MPAGARLTVIQRAMAALRAASFILLLSQGELSDHLQVLSILWWFVTRDHQFARLFDTVDLAKDLAEILTFLEVDGECRGGYAAECHVNLWLMNLMRFGKHRIEYFHLELFDCQVWHCLHGTTLKVLLCNVFELFCLEEKSYWHTIRQSHLCLRLSPGKTYLCLEICWGWPLHSWWHFPSQVYRLRGFSYLPRPLSWWHCFCAPRLPCALDSRLWRCLCLRFYLA